MIVLIAMAESMTSRKFAVDTTIAATVPFKIFGDFFYGLIPDSLLLIVE